MKLLKKVVLPEVWKVNDSLMNKNLRDQTKFSPEKKDPRKKKMSLLLSVYLLTAITQAKKTRKKTK